jgi:hypothetical protein
MIKVSIVDIAVVGSGLVVVGSGRVIEMVAVEAPDIWVMMRRGDIGVGLRSSRINPWNLLNQGWLISGINWTETLLALWCDWCCRAKLSLIRIGMVGGSRERRSNHCTC